MCFLIRRYCFRIGQGNWEMRKLLLILFITIGAVLSASSADKGDFSVFWWGTDIRSSGMKSAIDEYQGRHPDISMYGRSTEWTGYWPMLAMRAAGSSLPAGLWFSISSTIILAAGSMFILWLGERITDKGVGNGISFIILVGIIARLPHSLFQEFVSRTSEKTGGLVMFLFEMLFLLLVIAGAILLVQGVRKVPVQYAKRIVGNKQYGGARQYIPLKVNAANVMPIIFAQAIMFIPISIVGFSNTGEQSGWVAAFMDNTGFWYNFVFAILIILFTYFYTAITINPTQMSDDLKRNNGFIPGIKPGNNTKEYLDTIMSRITLPGAFFLALVAILPAFARIAGVSMEFSQFFGGTSLLILVGVVLDTLQQIESHLLMRHYDGLLKSGRIKGRSGAVGAY